MNKVDFDFHLHCLPGSPDSSQTVLEAVKVAKENGITTLAITDHNSIGSFDDIDRIEKEEGIKIIPGIECSTIIQEEIPSLKNVTIHVLGLGITKDKRKYNKICKKPLRRTKKWNAKLIRFCQRFYKRKFKSHLKEELKNELVELGYFTNRKEAKAFLNEDHKGVGICISFKISEIVETIHKLGGIAILAHPTRAEKHRVLNSKEIILITEYLVSHGLDGIELFHPDVVSSKEDFDTVKSLVDKYNLLISLGNDRHNAKYSNDSYFRYNIEEYKEYDFGKIKDQMIIRLKREKI